WAASRALLDALIEAERGRFALWLPVFMGVGVLLYFSLRSEPQGWIGARFAVAGFVAGLASPRWPALRAIGFCTGFGALGFASAQYAPARLPPIEADLPAQAVMVSGTVRSVEVLSYARRITLGGVALTAPERTVIRPAGQEPGQPARRLVRTVRIRLRAGD